MAISGKRIVITGGASGLGLELVRQLTPDNEIIVIARESEGLKQLGSDYPEISIFKADLSDDVAVKMAATDLVAKFPAIDGLINNAALQYTPSFLDPDFEYDQIAKEVAINFTTPAQLCYLLLPSLLKGNLPFILNVNSGLGLVPKTSSAIYCATKGGLNILSQALQNQLEQTDVAVLQAFLPLVDTAMTKGRGEGKLPPDRVASDILKGIAARKAMIDVGKVKLLRPISRFMPRLARKIMKSG
ncbi:SDR family NAD(P)-dependent oxidoreductase [Parasphingorhabdus litoris]|uniref:SDR family NAD(P)-dependent oxidoreductase n=1 Tax=Parasphingorhabdus litoris TaxID=394733 RepID=A0ABN1A695_9SPHN|nr:SDR family NAD(P)-dependent oxidoreductase [Parasphingorhabdus litoris]